MKLSKIYSNQTEFKSITFKNGLNVIYGDVESSLDTSTGKAHPHNIGKTSLVELIDFLLLKTVTKKNLFGKHSTKFANWTFYLEIELNSGKFVTIKRSVGSQSKVSFKEHFSPNQNFINEPRWDYENYSMYATNKDDTPTNILNEYLAFDVVTEYNYRTTLGYLLRNQNDYRDVFKLDKFRGSDSYWKPALYALLGFSSETLMKKYDLESEKTDENKFINRLQSDGEPEEVYKIKAAIDAKQQEKKNIKQEVDKFDFYKQEQSINFDLVNNVETRIAILNKERYGLDYELQQIRKSLDSNNKIDVDFEEIKILFEETKLFFPESLSKDYKAVSEFSKQISIERTKYLTQELQFTESRISEIKADLILLNTQRGDMLASLREKDTFIKYQSFQDDLAKIEAEIATFEAQLNSAQAISVYQESLEKTKSAITKIGRLIKRQIDEDNSDYKEIRKLFQEAFRDIMGYTALLVVQPNKDNNVDFETVVLNNAKDVTGKGDGFTATKTLCACFALSLLAHYSSRSFYRFAYHDGVLGDAGDNPRINLLNVAREYSEKYNIQYIVSAIKSDIPQGSALKTDEIRRTLTEKDTLFGIDF